MGLSNEELDNLIVSCVGAEWEKTALLISKVFDNPAFDKEGLSGQDVAERLYILIDNGQIEVEGNMRRWRDSKVKLRKIQK